MSGEGMTPHAFALALSLCAHEDAAPLPVRAAWLAFLRRCEPDPEEVRRAVLKAHGTGHLRAGKLTREGVQAAREALSGTQTPPGSERGTW